MAIGIIAVAFVALIGLLPVGLNTYRASIDESNQTWILQSMNSMIQTTDFAHVPDLDYQTSREMYYYDEEGKMTDKESQPGDPKAQAARIYAVKLLVDKLYRPDGTTVSSNDQLMTHGWRVIAAIAPYLNSKAMTDMGNLTEAQGIPNLPKDSPIRTKTFYVARMDSQAP
jgi:uncharacterized protein (TIGR02598 family)